MEINQDIVPSTIKQAVSHIVESLDEDDRKFIASNPPISIHMGVGRYIRNSWSLWEQGTPIKLDAINTYKIAHADDISGLIFAWVWAVVNDQDFDPMEYVKKYHKHWAKYGKTSIEAGGCDG